MVTAESIRFLWPKEQRAKNKETEHSEIKTWVCPVRYECENGIELKKWRSRVGRRCSWCQQDVVVVSEKRRVGALGPAPLVGAVGNGCVSM